MPTPSAAGLDLPIGRKAAESATLWLKTHFGAAMTAAVNGTPFGVHHLCGIVCQETAYRWLSWRDEKVEVVLARCVLDGSGDVAGAPRQAFPKNTAAFLDEYGQTFTKMLVDEGNKMRGLMGFKEVDWIYKGYGIFQYDLQFVKTDRAYFEGKKWYSFDTCLDRVMKELKAKWARVQAKHPQESQEEKLRQALKAYNGSGPRAESYSKNVVYYSEVAREAW